jgi:phosphoglycolate phosphatase-like HAD superfamily hydrolase
MVKISSIRTIIWDLDGTLLDSFGIFVDSMKELLPKHGRKFPGEDVIAANYHGSLEDAINGATKNSLSAEELKAVVSDFLSMQDSKYEVIEGHLFPDAEDLAARAHKAGIKQILVTNRDHEGRNKASPRSVVANSNLKNYIDLVICGDDSEHRKPKPEVLGDFGHIYVPEETLVIGDQFVDAEFAHNLGVRAFIVKRHSIDIPHMDRLTHDWQSHVIIDTTLDNVML